MCRAEQSDFNVPAKRDPVVGNQICGARRRKHPPIKSTTFSHGHHRRIGTGLSRFISNADKSYKYQKPAFLSPNEFKDGTIRRNSKPLTKKAAALRASLIQLQGNNVRDVHKVRVPASLRPGQKPFKKSSKKEV
uniref:Uncharacterized protein n=1 Tax=Salix viminalis TaxID=40686 RepID=A0A6N2NIY6_SALVM